MQRFLAFAATLLLAVALLGSMLCFVFRDFLARFPTSSF